MENENLTLHATDYVHIKPNGDFVKFWDGQIVIYGNKSEADEDGKPYNCKVVSCVDLNKKQQREVMSSIRKFKKAK